jgi:hypothetical protein
MGRVRRLLEGRRPDGLPAVKTLTPKQAEERFGRLIGRPASCPLIAYLDFQDEEGRWVPRFNNQLNLERYELEEEQP